MGFTDKTGDEISLEYDERGNIVRVSNIANQAFLFDYQQYQGLSNQSDLLKTLTLPNGQKYNYKYNSENQLIEVETKITNSATESLPVLRSQKQQYGYNNEDLLCSIKDPETVANNTVNGDLVIEYDDKVRPTVIKLPKVSGEANRSETHFSYEDIGMNTAPKRSHRVAKIEPITAPLQSRDV